MRSLTDIVKEQLIYTNIVIVTGPSESGKTILLKELYQELDLYNPKLYINYSKKDNQYSNLNINRNIINLLKSYKDKVPKNKKLKVYIDNLCHGLDRKSVDNFLKEIEILVEELHIKIIAVSNNFYVLEQVEKVIDIEGYEKQKGDSKTSGYRQE